MGHFYDDRSSSIIFRGDSDIRTNLGPEDQVLTLITFADLQLRMWVRQRSKICKMQLQSCLQKCRFNPYVGTGLIDYFITINFFKSINES